MQYVISSY